jgi:hypothetical protein
MLIGQNLKPFLCQLGDRRAVRLAYSDKILEIRMPTPEHEVDKELIGNIVKTLLDELEIDCECFGSTTLDLYSAIWAIPASFSKSDISHPSDSKSCPGSGRTK